MRRRIGEEEGTGMEGRGRREREREITKIIKTEAEEQYR